MKASNYYLRVVGNDPLQLASAISLAVDTEKVRAWEVRDDWFILYWDKELDDVHAFPFDEDVPSVVHTVRNWLKEQKPDLSSEPKEYQGSVMWEGWELRSGWESCHEAEPESSENDHLEYEVLRIRPRWAEYHK